MTHQLDVTRGRDVAARWCALAEARLEHLTELFETGRWRRYHSEHAFLENIQEAKAAVQTWRDLSLREAALNNNAIDMSWLSRSMAALPRSAGRDDWVKPRQPAAIPVEPPPPIVASADRRWPGEASPEAVVSEEVVPEEVHFKDARLAEKVPSAPVSDDASGMTRGIAAAILERYPLLRNAL